MYEADQVKERTDLKPALEFYGLQFNRHGFALCPFHNEKTGSLKVKNQVWKCYGCGEGGDIIDFIKKMFNLEFWDALAKLDSDFNLRSNLADGYKADAQATNQYRAKQRLKQARIEADAKAVDKAIADDRNAHKLAKAFEPSDIGAEFPDNFIKAINRINEIEIERERW